MNTTTILLPTGEKIEYVLDMPNYQNANWIEQSKLDTKKRYDTIFNIIKDNLQNWQPCGVKYEKYIVSKCWGPATHSNLPMFEIFYLGSLSSMRQTHDGSFEIPIGKVKNHSTNEIKKQILTLKLNELQIPNIDPKYCIEYSGPNSESDWKHNIFSAYSHSNHSRSARNMARNKNYTDVTRNFPTEIIFHKPTLEEMLSKVQLNLNTIYPKN